VEVREPDGWERKARFSEGKSIETSQYSTLLGYQNGKKRSPPQRQGRQDKSSSEVIPLGIGASLGVPTRDQEKGAILSTASQSKRERKN